MTSQKAKWSIETTSHVQKGNQEIYCQTGASSAQNTGVSEEHHDCNGTSFSTAAKAVSVGNLAASSSEKQRESTQSSIEQGTSSMLQSISASMGTRPTQVSTPLFSLLELDQRPETMLQAVVGCGRYSS